MCFILVLISSIWKIAEPWKIYLWIWIAAVLPLVLIPVLGKPIHFIWLQYVKITSEGMRFFQGFGIVLILVAIYLLRYSTFEGTTEDFYNYLANISLENFPTGKFRYWGIVGAFLLITGLIRIAAKFLYKVWMTLAGGLQAITSRIILFLVYATAVLPVGLVAKLVGKKFMDKSYRDESRKSYWLDRDHKFDPKSYYRHF